MSLTREERKLLHLRRCATDQVARVRLGGNVMSFRDAHVVEKDGCVEKPCESRLHAVQTMVAYAAKGKEGLRGKEVELVRTPCDLCARLMISSGIARLAISEMPTTDEDELVYELLAVAVPLDFGPPIEKRKRVRFSRQRKSPKAGGSVSLGTPSRKTPRIASEGRKRAPVKRSSPKEKRSETGREILKRVLKQ